ncbi:MAG: Lysophospholipase 1 [Chaenotheca gracillima]|nr:MAG: Lysophospholipase 1 [Chaenotheca gracillima]
MSELEKGLKDFAKDKPSKGKPSFTKTSHKKPYPAIDPSRPELSAKGKVILITAGHTGIGRAIADAFGTAGAAHVAIVGRRSDIVEQAAKELEAKHPSTKYHPYAGSITDAARVGEIFDDIRSNFGGVDVIVTSAVYISQPKSALNSSIEDFRASIETNVFGHINVLQELVKDAKSGDGKERVVLDVSSAAAHIYIPSQSLYAVSKQAYTHFLEHVAKDNAVKGLRVHSFHPATVLSDAARGFGLDENSMPWDDAALPGNFAVWLASKEGAFLSGRFVYGNWDVEELIEKKPELENDRDLLTDGLRLS